MTSLVSPRQGARSGYLLLDTTPAIIALPAASVLEIAQVMRDANAPHLNLHALLPVGFMASQPAWLIRIGDDLQSLVTLVQGKLRLEYFSSDSLLTMPTIRCGGFDLFSNVMVANSRPSALVVNIASLLRTHQGLGET